MPAIQTTYTEGMGLPSPGSIHGSNYDTITGICETDAPGIGFGLAVGQGAESDQGVVLGGTLAKFRGVSLRDATLRGDSASVDHYLPPNSVGIIRQGQVWVLPNADVVPGDDVYFDSVTGRFGTATGGNAVGPIKGASWQSTGNTNTVARLYLAGYDIPSA